MTMSLTYYDDEDFDTFKYQTCIECEHFKKCEEDDFNKIEGCMTGLEISEHELELKDFNAFEAMPTDIRM